MPEKFCLRTCCRTAPEKVAFLAPIDPSSDAGGIVRVAANADLEPDPIVAFHEAGHLVVGLLFGMKPADVLAGRAGFVTFDTPHPSQQANVTMLLAGDFAGGLAHRHEHRPSDAELTPWLDLVRQPAGGFCDRCRILRALALEHGLDAPNEVIFAAYRAAEVRTLEILRRLDVRAAIRAVADALMKNGRLSGGEAVEIARRFIVPGELLTEKETFHEAD